MNDPARIQRRNAAVVAEYVRELAREPPPVVRLRTIARPAVTVRARST